MMMNKSKKDKEQLNELPPDPFYILRGHKYFISSVVFDKVDPNILYSGSGDGELKLWNIEEKKCIQSQIAHAEGGVLSLQSTPHGLVSQGRDGTIKIWNIHQDRLETISKIETNSISLGKCSSLLSSRLNSNNTTTTTTTTNNTSPDNNVLNNSNSNNSSSNLLAISSDESPSQVELWDLDRKEIVKKFNPSPSLGGELQKLGLSMSLKLFYDENGNIKLCSGYENGTMIMWDIRNSDDHIVYGKLHNEPILSFDLSSNGINGISGSADNNIIEFNIDYANKQFEVTKKHILNNNGISQVRIRQDEKIYATSGWDRRIRIFNFKKHTPLAILKYHTESIYTLDFSSNNILASGSKDMKIALWSIYNSN
ncbi:hypothetical protein CYY_005492 [Polysphondylium violaceum]|uniref:Guanine nucleotide-binding protein subunit beta-like protein 1 n=1 Tax=Polysphondylium violaceum TaxID=133409 RepID=A0A8J4PT09_9MYCE|nr:hypothetical protein CYY_005492 [Polysphondylium violaceum]